MDDYLEDEWMEDVLAQNAAWNTVAPTGDETQDPGLACINLADLLEAPRQLPLDCLLGLGNKEECELYSSAPEPYVGKSVQTELYGRLPWLLGLLVFLSVSSAILEFFDVLLQKHLIIAFYLTALVGCGGNAGSQAASLVLQALATGELVPTFADFWRVLRKELLVALGIAATLSLGIFGRILLFGGSAVDALAIALAMAVTVSFSVLFGASAPLLLQRAGADPAKVSGPLLSTVIDIAGVLVACLSAQLLEAVGAWDTMEKL
ncbi:Magnesium transporter MgtE [Symbiodinium microadriaticum]|uniref:Magnesium transporter MgtE n=1 Tax=Symbiodinium microadriaticum TaxID=2951 RepID=A0A1Q9CU72_SYMMI|nr:Magnesium transporter MgtE [Symbiodinium microadriaticum]